MLIKTKQFILRPFRLADAPEYSKNGNNKEIHRNMARFPYPFTLKDAKKCIRRYLKEYKKPGSNYLALAIVIDNEVVGFISVNRIVKGHKAAIGYWLAKKHWGKGLMTKIVKAMSDYAFKKYKLKRLEAHVYLFNPASKRVLEKCGFKLEGILRKEFKKGNRFLDNYLMAKVK